MLMSCHIILFLLRSIPRKPSANQLFAVFHTKKVPHINVNRVDFTPSTFEDAAEIYEDDDILVFHKPSNMLSVPGSLDKYNLASEVRKSYNIPRVDHMISHRLDYATSGLIVFARNEESLKNLNNQFRTKNKVYKRYTAIVHGIISVALEGEITLPLGRDPVRGGPCVHVDSSETGKPSRTEWQVLKRWGNQSYVHLRPLSGRTHQLRVHMSSIGHPIIGDYFYAHDEAYYNPFGRLMLHAEYLGIQHPRTLKDMLFYSPCPLISKLV